MKKLTLSLAVAAAVGATAANAAIESEYSVGLLVPNVIHDGAGNTTAVGIIAREAGTVYWTFFDEDSNHITNGQFDVTANDLHQFIWQDEAGFGLEDKRGYLVFVADVAAGAAGGSCNNNATDGLITACDAALAPIAGAAVQVIPPSDVAFLPAFPLVDIDLSTFPITPTNLGPADVDYLLAGANCVAAGSSITGTIGTLTENITGPYNDDIDMRYFIDGSPGGDDTRIAVWSAQMIGGTYTVNMFDDKQARKSVNFTLDHEELNFIDPEAIAGRPAGFTDGFIRWDVPCGFEDAAHRNSAPFNGVVTFSVISAPSFGAVQTIINPFGRNVTP